MVAITGMPQLRCRLPRAFADEGAAMLWAALFFMLLVLPPVANAEKHVALVVGNSAYKYAGGLANPT
jgi:hypothetical protein